MKKSLILTSILLFAAARPVVAEDTGLASIHDLKYETGRRVCMSDHFHDGNGSGATRKEAEAAAKKSWIEFTAFEYGGVWGNYKLAESKSADCTEVAEKWTCAISARPCKRYVKPTDDVSQSASR
jgi:hypothetical protein